MSHLACHVGRGQRREKVEEKLRFGSQEDGVMSSHVSPGDLPWRRGKEGDTGSQRGTGRLQWVRGSSRAQRRNSRRQGEGRGKVGHGAVLLELFFFPLSAERAALREGEKRTTGTGEKRTVPTLDYI